MFTLHFVEVALNDLNICRFYQVFYQDFIFCEICGLQLNKLNADLLFFSLPERKGGDKG